jgi:hypothetical protein
VAEQVVALPGDRHRVIRHVDPDRAGLDHDAPQALGQRLQEPESLAEIVLRAIDANQLAVVGAEQRQHRLGDHHDRRVRQRHHRDTLKPEDARPGALQQQRRRRRRRRGRQRRVGHQPRGAGVGAPGRPDHRLADRDQRLGDHPGAHRVAGAAEAGTWQER